MLNTTQLSLLFKALSEPVRIRLIALLRLKGELCVCELVTALELPQSVVSRHLAYLRNAGLALARRDGIWMYYQIDAGMTRDVDTVLAVIEHNSSHCQTLRADLARLNTAGTCK